MTKILQLIGSYLGWLDKITGNYMVALLLFALTVEILLLPLAIKRQKTSIKQAKLRPKEMAIQKKYAGRTDAVTRQKMQQEIMEMHQKEGFNQFGGCLPMLIQLPIVLVLYQIVIDPLKYVLRISDGAVSTIKKFLEFSDTRGGTIGLITKIKEVGLEGLEGLKSFAAEGLAEGAGEAAYEEIAGAFANLPNFNIFGGAIDLGAMPNITSFNWLLLVPVLTFLTYFLSMKLTRKLTYQPAAATGADEKAMGCSNTIMDLMMPLFSVYITFVVPAAIGVYWIFKSILSTIQQAILYKLMPLPKFTEEDYKAAERELAGKNKNRPVKKERDPNAPRVRSLHHIDDEDYDDKGNYIAPAKEPEVSADKTPVDVAPLKDDDRREEKPETDEQATKEDN